LARIAGLLGLLLAQPLAAQPGRPVWPEFLPLNTTAYEESPLPLNRNVQVETNGQGVWMATWSTTQPVGAGDTKPDRDIVVARSLDDGNTWSAPFALHPDAGTANDPNYSGSDDFSSVAASGNVWVATWIGSSQYGSREGTGLFMRRSPDNGATWSPLEALNGTDEQWVSHDSRPGIATDGNGTWMIVVGREVVFGLEGIKRVVMAYRSTDDGLTWTGGTPLPRLVEGSGVSAEDGASIATDRNGNWVAVWRATDLSNYSDTRIAASTSRDNGLTWSPQTAIWKGHLPLPHGPANSSDLRYTEDGRFVAMWVGNKNGIVNEYRLFSAYSSKQGASWSTPVEVPPSVPQNVSQLRPSIASDGQSNSITAWTGLQEGHRTVLIASSFDDGGNTTTPAPISNESPAIDMVHWNPDVAASPSGTYVLAWEGENRYETGYIPAWGKGTDILFTRAQWAGNQRPSLTIDTPATDTGVGAGEESLTVGGTSGDPDGSVEFLYWRLNGQAWQSVATPGSPYQFQATGLALGRNVLEVRAQDNANTYSQTERRIIIRAGGSPPANDHSDSAQEVLGFSGQVTGDNRNATPQAGEADPMGDLATAFGADLRTVWYRYTAPGFGRVRFSTCGSTNDTILDLFAAAEGGLLTPLVRNDDASGSQSEVTFDVEGGENLYVRVDTYGEGDGPFTLSYEFLHYFELETSSYKPDWGAVSTIPLPVPEKGYLEGTSVLLHSRIGRYGDSRIAFESWSGDGLESPYTGRWNRVTMDGPKSVHARFKPIEPQFRVDLQVIPEGAGTVGAWTENLIETGYFAGYAMTLNHLTDNPPYRFSFWENDKREYLPDPINYSTERRTATFKAHFGLDPDFAGPHPQHDVTFRVYPPGAGTIVPSLAPLESGQYRHGEVVDLTAVPEVGYTLRNWGGDVLGHPYAPGKLHVVKPSEAVAFFRPSTSPQSNEPNNSWQDAFPVHLPRDGIVEFQSKMEDVEDWYELTLPPLAHFRARITFSVPGTSNIQAQLWDRRAALGDEWGMPLSQSYRSTPESTYEEITFVNMSEPASLLLRVYDDGLPQGQDYLVFFSIFEVDDTYDTAGRENNTACSNLPMLPIGQTHTDLICRNDDWYRVMLPAGATKLSVSACHEYFSGDINLMVVDDSPADCGTAFSRILAGGYGTVNPDGCERIDNLDVTGRSCVLIRVYGADNFSRNFYNLRVDAE